MVPFIRSGTSDPRGFTARSRDRSVYTLERKCLFWDSLWYTSTEMMKLPKIWSSQLKITLNNWRRPVGHSSSPLEKIVSWKSNNHSGQSCYRYDNHLSSSSVKKQTSECRSLHLKWQHREDKQQLYNTNFFNQCGMIFRLFLAVSWNIYPHRETWTFTNFLCFKPQTFSSNVSSFLCTLSTNAKGYMCFQLCQVILFQRGTNLL